MIFPLNSQDLDGFFLLGHVRVALLTILFAPFLWIRRFAGLFFSDYGIARIIVNVWGSDLALEINAFICHIMENGYKSHSYDMCRCLVRA